MNIPQYLQEALIKEDGYPTDAFSDFLRSLLQGMQLSISDEGYLIPSVSSDPNSVMPPTTGGQLLQLQNSFQGLTVNPNTQTVTTGVQVGTIIFDPAEVNGGTTAPLGQLKVLLNDGMFHKITNT